MKRAFTAVLLILCSGYLAASSPQNSGSLQLPPFSKDRLENGITVLLMEHHEVPLVSFSFVIKTGSAADPEDKAGLASLTADLLRKGTRSRSSDQIANELDFLGGGFSISSGVDFTSVDAEFLRKDVQQGIDILADILMNPVLPEEELTKLITQRIDGIKSEKDRADSVIARYFNRYLYGSHPYGRPNGGDETSLAGITRADIQRFYDGEYTPSNVIVAVAGDFEAAAMRGMLERRFAGWTAKPLNSPSIKEPLPAGRRLLLVDKPDSTQTYFYIGNIGISRTNADRVAAGLVNTLFGGRFTSRLNTALRTDTGLTYGARSVFDQRKLPGPFFIATYTRNAATERAIDMTLDLLRDFREKGISEDELKSAANYLKGQFPTSIETSSQLASMIARLEFYGLDEGDINNYGGKIDSITLAQANEIIRQYFPADNLVFVLIGKADEIESIVEKYAPVIEKKSISAPGF